MSLAAAAFRKGNGPCGSWQALQKEEKGRPRLCPPPTVCTRQAAILSGPSSTPCARVVGVAQNPWQVSSLPPSPTGQWFFNRSLHSCPQGRAVPMYKIQGRKSGCADNLLFLACVQVMLELLFWEPQSLRSWLCVPGKLLRLPSPGLTPAHFHGDF